MIFIVFVVFFFLFLLKIFSKKGYGGLTRTIHVNHTEDYPAPNEYNISNSLINIKETKYPFLSTIKRNMFTINKNPGYVLSNILI